MVPRRARSFRAAMVVALATVVAAPPAAPRSPATPHVDLRGVTRIHATHSAHAHLRVPEDVSLLELEPTISGGGRIAGYAITDWGRRDEGGFLVQSFVFNRCLRPGCPAAEQPLTIRWAEGVRNGVLPAGTYDLYVIADEAPVVITFEDRHLSGEEVARLPATGIDAVVATLPRNRVTTPGGEVFSAGRFESVDPGRGMGMLGLWAMGSDHLGAAFGSCFYFARTLAPRDEAAFLPGCPTGYSHTVYPHLPAQPGGRSGVVYQSTYHDVPLGIGGWVTSAARVDDVGAVALWLRF